MTILYNIFIWLYTFIVHLISPFNEKAKLWKEGRENIFNKLQEAIKPGDQIIWMHCASLGEFEQGRPLLEKLKTDFPAYKILLTFFSPSGYEVRKNYSGADYIFYLPMDSSKNAKLFFEIVNPILAIFIKYDFWHYYLTEARKRSVPLLLVSAIFRQHQPFFSSYGQFHRSMLASFTYLFVQNEESLTLLKTIGITGNVTVSGDTRFDRVIEIAEQFKPISAIESFCANKKVVVAGSTWSEDDEALAHYANAHNEIKFLIAPHHINKSRIEQCQKLYKNSFLFSEMKASPGDTNLNTVIINNIGMLSSLYKYATVAYIGGGFGKDGIHNALEAAVYGKPVVFGPEYSKYLEAVELVQIEGAFSINSAQQLEVVLNKLFNEKDVYYKSGSASLNYVYSKQGATQKVITFIQEKRLLTN